MSSIQSVYHYTKAESATNILNTGKIRFSTVSKFNDPWDARVNVLLTEGFDIVKFIYLVKNKPIAKVCFNDVIAHHELNKKATNEELKNFLQDFLFDAFDEVNAKNISLVRILSCSTCHDIPSMWAHYADNYEGVVLEFKNPNNGMENLFQIHTDKGFSSNVDYLDIEPRYNESKLAKLAEALSCDINWIMNEHLKPALFSKSKHWSYEQEYRVIRTLKTHLPFNNEHYSELINDENLECVYFGYKIKPWYQNYITNLLEKKYCSAKISKITALKKNYNLKFESIV